MKYSSHTESRSRCWVSFIVLLVAFRSKPFLQILLKVFTQSGGKHKCLKAIFDSFFLVAILYDLISRDVVEVCRDVIISVPGTHSQTKHVRKKKNQQTSFLEKSAEGYFRPQQSVLLQSFCLPHQVREIVDFLSLLLNCRPICRDKLISQYSNEEYIQI